jgi:hypothetical protein
MHRTMRKSAPRSSAASEVCTMRATVSKLLAWLLSRLLSWRQAERAAESVIAQPCETANRSDVRNPRSGMSR